MNFFWVNAHMLLFFAADMDSTTSPCRRKQAAGADHEEDLHTMIGERNPNGLKRELDIILAQGAQMENA